MSTVISQADGSSQTTAGTATSQWTPSAGTRHSSVEAVDAAFCSSGPNLGLAGTNAGYSYYLDLVFPIANIPVGATMSGVEFTISRGETLSTGVYWIKDSVIQQIFNGTVDGQNKPKAAAWNNPTYTNAVYGGAADLWGLDTSPARYNTTTSGLRIQVYTNMNSLLVAPEEVTRGDIDYVTRTLYYTEFVGGATAFIRQTTRMIPDVGRRTY